MFAYGKSGFRELIWRMDRTRILTRALKLKCNGKRPMQ
jgi:hypothetical protein